MPDPRITFSRQHHDRSEHHGARSRRTEHEKCSRTPWPDECLTSGEFAGKPEASAHPNSMSHINPTTHHYLTTVMVVDERKSSVDRGVIHFPVLVSLSPSIMLTSPSYISPASSPPATPHSDPATAPVSSHSHRAVHRQPDLHSGTQAAERQPFLVVGN